MMFTRRQQLGFETLRDQIQAAICRRRILLRDHLLG
jgi:hypothetical protein